MNKLTNILSSKIFWIVLFLLLYYTYLYFRTQHNRKKAVTEYEKLVILARIKEKSEFDIFGISGEKWSVSEERLNRDFRIYLESGTIPFYVRDYIRSNEGLLINGLNLPQRQKHRGLI